MTSVGTVVCIATKLQSVKISVKTTKIDSVDCQRNMLVVERTWVAIALRLEARCDAQE